MVPITSQIKGYPFEVPIHARTIKGVALSDHLKNMDWKVRGVRFAAKASAATLEKVTANVAALINMP